MINVSDVPGYLIAGSAGGIIVKYLTYNLDARKMRQDARRNEVQKWRELIGNFASREKSDDTFLSDPKYLSLRRHIAADVVKAIESKAMYVSIGSKGISENHRLLLVQIEVDRLERKWKLT